MRQWFSKIVSSETYILNHSTYSPFLSTHLNRKPKNSFMLLIMLLIFAPHSGFSHTPLLPPSVHLYSIILNFHNICEQTPHSILSFRFLSHCAMSLSSGCKLCHPLSQFCICASDTRILISDYFLQVLFTHSGPFPLLGTYC